MDSNKKKIRKTGRVCSLTPKSKAGGATIVKRYVHVTSPAQRKEEIIDSSNYVDREEISVNQPILKLPLPDRLRKDKAFRRLLKKRLYETSTRKRGTGHGRMSGQLVRGKKVGGTGPDSPRILKVKK